jgi:hypothetical protein
MAESSKLFPGIFMARMALQISHALLICSWHLFCRYFYFIMVGGGINKPTNADLTKPSEKEILIKYINETS